MLDYNQNITKSYESMPNAIEERLNSSDKFYNLFDDILLCKWLILFSWNFYLEMKSNLQLDNFYCDS